MEDAKWALLINGGYRVSHTDYLNHVLRQQEALHIVERAKVEGVFVPNKEPNRAQRRAAKRRKP